MKKMNKKEFEKISEEICQSKEAKKILEISEEFAENRSEEFLGFLAEALPKNEQEEFKKGEGTLFKEVYRVAFLRGCQFTLAYAIYMVLNLIEEQKNKKEIDFNELASFLIGGQNS